MQSTPDQDQLTGTSAAAGGMKTSLGRLFSGFSSSQWRENEASGAAYAMVDFAAGDDSVLFRARSEGSFKKNPAALGRMAGKPVDQYWLYKNA